MMKKIRIIIIMVRDNNHHENHKHGNATFEGSKYDS